MDGIHVDHLQFSYKSNAPLISCDSLDFSFSNAYALIGENGSGKTTFLKLPYVGFSKHMRAPVHRRPKSLGRFALIWPLVVTVDRSLRRHSLSQNLNGRESPKIAFPPGLSISIASPVHNVPSLLDCNNFSYILFFINKEIIENCCNETAKGFAAYIKNSKQSWFAIKQL